MTPFTITLNSYYQDRACSEDTLMAIVSVAINVCISPTDHKYDTPYRFSISNDIFINGSSAGYSNLFNLSTYTTRFNNSFNHNFFFFFFIFFLFS